MQLRTIEEVAGLYEIIDDNGKSVIDADAVKFGMPRLLKRQLKNVLIQICQALTIKGVQGLADFIVDGLLKKIERNPRAVEHGLWEIRNPAHGGRLFFIMDDDGNVIVSAVNKIGKDRNAQENAVNRGINRWEKYLKS